MRLPTGKVLTFKLIIIVILVIGAVVVLWYKNNGRPKMANTSSSASGMQLISPAFRDGAQVPIQYTCKGQNVSPPLNFLGVPASAKSLALILHDPDAIGQDFTHWIMWDIPISTETIAANSVPVGAVQGLNGASQKGYIGPCPPAGSGTHRYLFELYALDKILGLPANSNRQQLEKAIGGHVIAHHTLTGLFAGD